MPRCIIAIVLTWSLSFGLPDVRAQSLPGTRLWEDRGDPAGAMVEGLHRFLDRELAASVGKRPAQWHRDATTTAAYQTSVEPNRKRFEGIIGAVGERVAPVDLSYVSAPDSPARLAENASLTVFAVRWSVYPGVEAEGLWLEPRGGARANVVVLSDCDTPPESIAGLSPGELGPDSRVAIRLAEAGCRVLVPTLIDRSDQFSGNPKVRMTNLTHREWIYRMAFETGRHIIGYEVDKVRAAVDWFTRAGQPKLPIGVAGTGEGGLIALYAAAVDTRIDAAWVGGYFGPREGVWAEPIDRNVWGLLTEFGDAEIASLIAPRGLVIEASLSNPVTGPPPPRNGRSDAASGRWSPPNPESVTAEFRRARALSIPNDVDRNWSVFPEARPSGMWNDGDLGRRHFLKTLKVEPVRDSKAEALTDVRAHFQPSDRMKRQVQQLVDYTQAQIRTSELRRSQRWSNADPSSPERWSETIKPYRDAFWEHWIGKFPAASEPLEAKSIQVFDEPKWKGYAVRLPVWPDVVASGILLLPKDLKEGERRPVVVCQHGLEGRPEDVVDPKIQSVYQAFGAQLADLGYIVYAPQNPYIGHDQFRLLQRKANPLKRSLFAVIVRQHERTLEWLARLPHVDPARIAFYGLSYGGKTAMRVPAILPGYCLSICSGDFNEWVVKNTNLDRPTSYMFTYEYDMYEFGLAELFNYAEMANLIAPRPFMVERGHQDAVGYDEWIGYEYAKVRRLYDTLGLSDRTALALFNGGHKIDGKETFPFLARHLKWGMGDGGSGLGK